MFLGIMLEKINNMGDITKCKGEECPIKEFCYRYYSEPTEIQSYFYKSPWDGKRCDMFWGKGSMSIWNTLLEITKPKNAKNSKNTDTNNEG